MFVVILSYNVPLEVIDAHRPAHLEFLNQCYREGVLLVSGPQFPRTGGILISQSEDREALWNRLMEDPFYIEGCADYQLIEFHASGYAPGMEKFVHIKGLNLKI